MPSLISAQRPLARCTPWPTMQLLPAAVIRLLDQAVHDLQGEGLPARRQDVVGMLVLNELPPGGAQALWRMVDRYQRRNSPARPGRRLASLMLRLPSPISLRIDLLIRQIHRLGPRAYRQELIGALISERIPPRRPALVASYDSYRQAHAAQAALSPQGRHQVLSTQRPDPGPRA